MIITYYRLINAKSISGFYKRLGIVRDEFCEFWGTPCASPLLWKKIRRILFACFLLKVFKVKTKTAEQRSWNMCSSSVFLVNMQQACDFGTWSEVEIF